MEEDIEIKKKASTAVVDRYANICVILSVTLIRDMCVCVYTYNLISVYDVHVLTECKYFSIMAFASWLFGVRTIFFLFQKKEFLQRMNVTRKMMLRRIRYDDVGRMH